MIPRINARTEYPYLINANVWGKEDENNSSIYKLRRTLSASLFLFKQPTNQPYVAVGCKNLSHLNLLLYWKAQRSQDRSPSKPREPSKAVPSQRALQAGGAARSRGSASRQQPGPCSGLLLAPAITNTFLCQVSSTPAQFPSAAHHERLGQHRGGDKQLAAEGGQRCCSFSLPEPA